MWTITIPLIYSNINLLNKDYEKQTHIQYTGH
jgi:hypothetical protein